MQRNGASDAFTLIELLLVLAVIAALAALVAPRAGRLLRDAKRTAALREMNSIRLAFTGAPNAPGLVPDMETLPGFTPVHLRIGNLFASTNLWGHAADSASTAFRLDAPGRDMPGFAEPGAFSSWDEDASRGWRGPYLATGGGTVPAGFFPSRDHRRFDGDATAEERGFFPDPSKRGLNIPDELWRSGHDPQLPDIDRSLYGFCGLDVAPLDPWGNPYVLQIPPQEAFADRDTDGTADGTRFAYARIVSAGPDGKIDAPCFLEKAVSGVPTDGDRRDARLAGRRPDGGPNARGDDLVLFLSRSDVYEEDTP